MVAIDPVFDADVSPDYTALQAQAVKLQAESLRQLLLTNVVRFRFFRVTYGSERDAVGTLDPAKYNYVFKGDSRPKPPGLVAYWDLGRRGWRSFYLHNVRDYEAISGPAAGDGEIGRGGPQTPAFPLGIDDIPVGRGRGLPPVSRKGEPESVFDAPDGVRRGLQVKLNGMQVAWNPGQFVLDGLMYSVPAGGFAYLNPTASQPRFAVLAVNFSGSPYIIYGDPNSGPPALYTGVPLAVFFLPEWTDGVSNYPRFSQRRPPGYEGLMP